MPQLPLWLLLLAPMFVDLLWGIFVLMGIEHARVRPGITAASPFEFYDYPISHSLLGGILWALLFGGSYFLIRRYRAGAVMLGLLVVSHWVLDVISHRPDVPVLPNGPYLGLGLWNSVPATILTEEAMLAIGAALYLRATRSGGTASTIGLWAMFALFAVIGVAGTLGPPPPSITPVAALGPILAAV
ncbi:MAG: hypothetical protein E6J78_15295, partial [Deltaproteobacteria bacterium]